MAYFRTVPEGLMEQAHMHAATQEAGNAVGVELGPVESLWKPGPVHKYGEWNLGVNNELNKDVVELPLLAIEAVLRSEELLLKPENYAFFLALWWAMEQEGTREEQ